MDGFSGEFKLYVDSKKISSDLNLGKMLRGIIESTEAVISFRDMIRLAKWENRLDKLEVSFLPDSEVREFLRNVRNRRGRRVYSDISMAVDHLGEGLYAMQTFAYNKKLDSLTNELNPMFNALGVGTVLSAQPMALRYDDRYSAIYLPPIVELLPAGLFREAMSNLRKRVKTSSSVVMQAKDAGVVKIDLGHMFEKALDALEANQILAVIRDGTHRARLASIGPDFHSDDNGKRARFVVLQGSSGRAHSVPINISDVLVVMQKPEKNEDRYLGFVQREMEYFKGIGVDG